MKKNILTTLLLICFGLSSFTQTRYLDDVFSAYTVDANVNYATNISVMPLALGGMPAPEPLYCDIYQPAGDSVTNRPVIIVAHTGSFLPPILNGQATGSKLDSSIVEQCRRWAKKGYVAVAMNNRLGWNPTSTDQNVRTSTLIQAAYRGVQDAKAMVRYMRMTAATGNNYGINPNKIVFGGHGTGAYIALGYATLDTLTEIWTLPKFINFSNPAQPVPYIPPSDPSNPTTTIFGNINGTDTGYCPVLDSNGAPIPGQFWMSNIPNNPSYSNDINMVFNLGGAVPDISWLQSGDVPMVSFHCANDPYAPIDTGDVIVPTTGEFVVEVMGSRTVQHYANAYGNNDVFVQAGFSDVFTTAANNHNSGYEGLYRFITPPPSTTPNAFGLMEEEQGSPWDWWNNTVYDSLFMISPTTPPPAAIPGFGAANSILGNPDMSAAKGNAYLDTIQGYLNPRIYVALNLGSTNIEEVINASTNIYPNPATDKLHVVSYAVNIDEIIIYNLAGKKVYSKLINANTSSMDINHLNSGVYFIEVKSKNSSVKKKLIVN